MSRTSYRSQTRPIFTRVQESTVTLNSMAGILVEQSRAPLGTGESCAPTDGCTAITVSANVITENGGPGVWLKTAFLKDFVLGGNTYAAFLQNLVLHNAMNGAGCAVQQTAPQILIDGVVAHAPDACATGTDEGSCNSLARCVWNSFSCLPAWNLQGGVGCTNNNRITGYNVSAPDPLAVGMRAVNNAAVRADNNEWLSSPKVSVGAGSFIHTNTSCASVGCSSP